MAWLAPALMAVACSSRASSAPSTPLAGCDHWAHALAAHATACNPIQRSSERETTVDARYRASCERRLALPGTTLKREDMERCAQELDVLPCGAALNDVICTLGRPGTLPDGARCGDGSQCLSTFCSKADAPGVDAGTISGARECGTCAPATLEGAACGGGATPPCISSTTCLGGTCIRVAYGGPGAPCTRIGLDCEGGLHCDLASGTCSSAAAVGQPCVSTEDCEFELACVMGRCVASLSDGAACSPSEGVPCHRGSVCAPASRTCAPLRWAEAGQACDGIVVQCADGPCTGTCPTIIADGQACSIDDPRTGCDVLARCTSGTCALDDGTACH